MFSMKCVCDDNYAGGGVSPVDITAIVGVLQSMTYHCVAAGVNRFCRCGGIWSDGIDN